MKKLKFNKRSIHAAFYTIVVLSTICFAVYPKTNSLLKKEDSKSIAYIANLKDVYKNSIINPNNKRLIDLVATNNEKTTPTNAVFGIPFKIDSENKGVYRISMSNTNGVCTVLGTADATPINLTLKEIENSDPKDYYLTPINESVTTGTVYVSCPVAIDDTNYKIKLYEHVETTVEETIEVEDEFLYASSELVLDYNAYQSQFNDLYDEFWEQLVAYLNLEKNQAILEEFDMYTKEADAKEINYKIFNEFLKYYAADKESNNYNPAVLNSIVEGNNSIPGITGSKETTPTGEKYTFNFEDSFIGLVKTYIFYNNPGTTRPASEYLYFSTDSISSSILRNTIEFTFKTTGNNTVGNEKEEENIQLLYEYIQQYTKKSDNFTIADLRSIVGNAPAKGDHDVHYALNIIDNAYNYLNSKIENKIRISYLKDASSTRIYASQTFMTGLDFAYGSESILTKSLKASLYSLNMYPAITSFDKDYPTYYEIHQDDAGNLKLVKVEVSKEDNCKYVYITDLNDNQENDIVKSYINQYISDKNIADLNITNIASNIPGLELKTANYPTDSTDTYNFITLKSDFMDYADMYLNGISQEEMLKLINKNSTSLAANLYDESVINSLVTSSQIKPSSTLLDTINGVLTETYYEVHYDSKNNKLLLIEVTPESNNSTTKILTFGNYLKESNIFQKNEKVTNLIKEKAQNEGYFAMYLFLPENLDTSIKTSLSNSFIEELYDYADMNNGVSYTDVIDSNLKYIYSFSEVGYY